mmetsp:Transcript_34116/g.53751  ORF Transcript_34116/g.53751 Transcript_34116/m.53751 type:complete len:229 (-) Transcript_34116:285-971(-)
MHSSSFRANDAQPAAAGAAAGGHPPPAAAAQARQDLRPARRGARPPGCAGSHCGGTHAQHPHFHCRGGGGAGERDGDYRQAGQPQRRPGAVAAAAGVRGGLRQRRRQREHARGGVRGAGADLRGYHGGPAAAPGHAQRPLPARAHPGARPEGAGCGPEVRVRAAAGHGHGGRGGGVQGPGGRPAEQVPGAPRRRRRRRRPWARPSSRRRPPHWAPGRRLGARQPCAAS